MMNFLKDLFTQEPASSLRRPSEGIALLRKVGTCCFLYDAIINEWSYGFPVEFGLGLKERLLFFRFG